MSDHARIAMQIQGYHLTNDTTEIFRFSNSGFSTVIGDDYDISYYEPLLSDSILISQDAESNDDAISIKLLNNGSLDEFDNYTFNAYEIKVYINIKNSPNPEKFYPIFSGKIDRVNVTKDTVTITAQSNFTSLDTDINPESFNGVEADFEGGDGLKDKTKPRLIGDVFNITPLLLKSNTLVYGVNWDANGNRAAVTSFSKIKDGGNPYPLDVMGGSGGDFTTTALMDAYSPPAGEYVTCLAEGTFKLGSSPVFTVTADVSQANNTYQLWLNLIATETDINSAIVHDLSTATIGGWFDSSSTYLQANEWLSQNRDTALWIDSSNNLNCTTIGNDTTTALNFIEAGLELDDDQDIPYFELQRLDYELPPKNTKLNYKKNYTIQEQSSLVSGLTDDEKELFKQAHLTVAQDNILTPDPYPLTNTKELDSALKNEAEAITELARWVVMRATIVDKIKLTCPILSANSSSILGAIATGAIYFLNISSPDLISDTDILISDNNTYYTPQSTLTLGTKVGVTGSRYGYSNKVFYIIKIEINTRLMQVIYTLRGLR